MYLWIPLPEGVPSRAFADRLMEEEGVIVLPGAGFGAGGEGFFRVSFIVPPARIARGGRACGSRARGDAGRVGREAVVTR